MEWYVARGWKFAWKDRALLNVTGENPHNACQIVEMKMFIRNSTDVLVETHSFPINGRLNVEVRFRFWSKFQWYMKSQSFYLIVEAQNINCTMIFTFKVWLQERKSNICGNAKRMFPLTSVFRISKQSTRKNVRITMKKTVTLSMWRTAHTLPLKTVKPFLSRSMSESAETLLRKFASLR